MHNAFDKVKYNNAYNKENYYRPQIALPKEYKPILQAKAEEYGSIKKYIQHLIDADLSRGGETVVRTLEIFCGRPPHGGPIMAKSHDLPETLRYGLEYYLSPY